jgi:hypothetical protein
MTTEKTKKDDDVSIRPRYRCSRSSSSIALSGFFLGELGGKKVEEEKKP